MCHQAGPTSTCPPATTTRPTRPAATRSSTSCTATRAARRTGSGPPRSSRPWTRCWPTAWSSRCWWSRPTPAAAGCTTRRRSTRSAAPRSRAIWAGPVVHSIDTRFRTIRDRAGRAVGGVSSGGYAALNLGLRHQDTYSVVVSLMPYGDPSAVTGTLLGGSRALWLANAPADYIPTMTFRHPMAVDLVAGSRDPQTREAARLARMLQARGEQAVFTEVPVATHTWRGARAEAPYALAFASAHLAGVRPRVSLAADRARPPGVSLAADRAHLLHPLAGTLADRPRFPRVTA